MMPVGGILERTSSPVGKGIVCVCVCGSVGGGGGGGEGPVKKGGGVSCGVLGLWEFGSWGGERVMVITHSMCKGSALSDVFWRKEKEAIYQDLPHGLHLERVLHRWLDLDFQLCFPAATRSCLTWLALAFSCGFHRSYRRQSQHCLLCRCRSRGDVLRGS